MTVDGRARFLAYLAVLEEVVQDGFEAPHATRGRQRDLPEGWLPT